MKRKEPFDVPGITESLAFDVKSGKITLHEAAIELHSENLLTDSITPPAVKHTRPKR